MTSKVVFTKLEHPSQIDYYDLDNFAASFDHKVARSFPIFVIHLNGKLMAYSHLEHGLTMSHPAIHPDISPRQTYEMGWQWHVFLKTSFGNPLIVMPKSLRPSVLGKMGLTPVLGDVYRILD
jgi:hypothetical protein